MFLLLQGSWLYDRWRAAYAGPAATRDGRRPARWNARLLFPLMARRWLRAHCHTRSHWRVRPGVSFDFLRVVDDGDAVRSWPPAAPFLTRERWAREARRAAHSYLVDVAGRFAASGVAIHREILGADNAAIGIITRTAQDPHTAMIAMSTHGRSGISRWLFGSVAEKVLRAISTPVLLVRAQEQSATFDHPVTYTTIAVPLDGSMFADQALCDAQVLAKPPARRSC